MEDGKQPNPDSRAPITIVKLGENVAESPWVSPEVISAMYGEQVEMGKTIVDAVPDPEE